MYVPAPPVPVPSAVTVVPVTPLPEITVPMPIEPEYTAEMVRVAPDIEPAPEKFDVMFVPTTK